ncbi:uncharacterized protein LOC118191006 isoform X2 [Stegodyphus dumicola]|uniref:uncharacterized protein LOC118191006 isoform X2 n=1 Tax=Stegodyphus dumicola TaxID=202533 RepID=UPI0015A97821|nr:uncharacterized protein LOC118191006 isoform X2 [Stegodyphus dumicola]
MDKEESCKSSVMSTIPCMCKSQLEDELLLNHEPGLVTYTQEVFQPVNNHTFSVNETEVHYMDYETSKYMQACQKTAIMYPPIINSTFNVL